MQERQQQDELGQQARKSRLVRIVIAHLLVVAAFFTASFFWGNFA